MKARGRGFSINNLIELACLCPKHGLIVWLDILYSLLDFNSIGHQLFNLLTLNLSLSKKLIVDKLSEISRFFASRNSLLYAWWRYMASCFFCSALSFIRSIIFTALLGMTQWILVKRLTVQKLHSLIHFGAESYMHLFLYVFFFVDLIWFFCREYYCFHSVQPRLCSPSEIVHPLFPPP